VSLTGQRNDLEYVYADGSEVGYIHDHEVCCFCYVFAGGGVREFEVVQLKGRKVRRIREEVRLPDTG